VLLRVLLAVFVLLYTRLIDKSAHDALDMHIKDALSSDAAWFVLLYTRSIDKERVRRVRHAYQGSRMHCLLMLHGLCCYTHDQ